MMRKRVLCLIMAAVLMLMLAACGESDPTEPATSAPTDAPTEATFDEPTEEPDDGIDLAAFIRNFHNDAKIEPMIVHDADGIKVTADSLRYDPISGVAIRFKAENTSAGNLLIQADTCAVNGYMMAVDFSLKADAAAKAEGEMVIPYTALALAGVDRIATIEFALQIMDQDKFSVLTECESAVIRTDIADDCVITYDDEGQVAWDSEKIKIVLKGIDEGGRIADSSVMIVYLYNGTDKDISVQSDAVWVNGYELTPAMTTTVKAGKHAVDVVPFFEMDLEEYGIERIDTVELSFRIVEEATWTVIAETELISVEL